MYLDDVTFYSSTHTFSQSMFLYNFGITDGGIKAMISSLNKKFKIIASVFLFFDIVTLNNGES